MMSGTTLLRSPSTSTSARRSSSNRIDPSALVPKLGFEVVLTVTVRCPGPAGATSMTTRGRGEHDETATGTVDVGVGVEIVVGVIVGVGVAVWTAGWGSQASLNTAS